MTKRILIVDDEEQIRRMMRLALETAGYEVGEAQNGPDGLQVYADGSNWNVVVLDQRMPGMDGLEVLKRIQARNPETRVIMATAYASIELAVDAMKLGATDFVRKPVTPELLRNAVAAALLKPLAGTASVATNGTPAEPKPLIQTVTMNGFTILDETETPAVEADQRRFVVVSPKGERHEVLVEIQSEPVEYVRRMTGRYLGPENTFWTSQARRLLSDYLWNEGKAPPMHRLVLRSIDPEKLPVAARWKA